MFKILKRKPALINGYYQNTLKKENNLKQIVLLVLFTAGVIVGSFTVRNGTSELLSEFFNIYGNYIAAKTDESLLTGFCNSFFITVITLILIYSLGLCAVGTPVLYVIPLISGIGVGTVSSFLYAEYSLKGIGYCALITYPGKIITTIIMISACTAGINMSTKILKILTNQEEFIDYKEYNLKYLAFSAFAVLSALTDTILNLLFSNYFIFN